MLLNDSKNLMDLDSEVEMPDVEDEVLADIESNLKNASLDEEGTKEGSDRKEQVVAMEDGEIPVEAKPKAEKPLYATAVASKRNSPTCYEVLHIHVTTKTYQQL